MKGSIKEQYKHKFNPTAQYVVGGRIVKVTLKEAETQAEKFVNTPLGIFYEDLEKLKEEAKTRAKKPTFVKVDMNKVKRGDAFDPEKNVQKNAIAEFRAKQGESLAKFARRNGGVSHKIETSNSPKKTKAADSPKKTKAAGKTE